MQNPQFAFITANAMSHYMQGVWNKFCQYLVSQLFYKGQQVNYTNEIKDILWNVKQHE